MSLRSRATTERFRPIRGRSRCGGGRHDGAAHHTRPHGTAGIRGSAGGVRNGLRTARDRSGTVPHVNTEGAIPLLKHIRMRGEDKNLLEKGFTLIELLVVIVILGILAAVVVFAVNGITD